MSSIRSTLIRSCFANIQKELLQLEDWLNRDFMEVPAAATSTKSSTDSSIIYQAIQQLSKQMDSQQHTLHHIIDRIDVLEETRNIHIEDENNLWLDTEGVQLQNEVVDYESIVNVNKTEESATEGKALPETIAHAVAALVTDAIEKKSAESVESVEHEVVQPLVVQPLVEPATVKSDPVESVVMESVAMESVVMESVVMESVATEEEEEEDGLEEVEYNGTTYYRDSNLFMYQLDDDGELTDAVGVWKEKTQAIKFYKK